MKKGVLRNSKRLTRKNLCQSLFLIKLQTETCNFIKKESLAQVFSCEFYEISKDTFITKHLWTTAFTFFRVLFCFMELVCALYVQSISDIIF